MGQRKRAYTRCTFLPYSHRANVPAGVHVYDVSSYADPPFCTLSPMWAHGGIPVPGMPGVVSDSVEGVWQGLKVLRGEIATRFFRGRGQKRGGKPSGHRFGDRLLGLVEARYRIYRPAYEWMLVHKVEVSQIQTFIDRAVAGEAQAFHDLEDNGDINNADAPLAHASLLAQYVNRLCEERMRS